MSECEQLEEQGPGPARSQQEEPQMWEQNPTSVNLPLTSVRTNYTQHLESDLVCMELDSRSSPPHRNLWLQSCKTVTKHVLSPYVCGNLLQQ